MFIELDRDQMRAYHANYCEVNELDLTYTEFITGRHGKNVKYDSSIATYYVTFDHEIDAVEARLKYLG